MEIAKNEQLKEFKTNWKTLTKSESSRESIVERLASAFERASSTRTFSSHLIAKGLSSASNRVFGLTSTKKYDALLGTVYVTPGKFGLWMPGVALIAAYLSERKKVEGLYVCLSLESLITRLNEISLNPADQRYAFVVGAFSSGLKNYYPFGFKANFPQHKVTVCVEKTDGRLTVALLDAQPLHAIRPENLNFGLWHGYDQIEKFHAQELVFRAILAACRGAKVDARLLHSNVHRQNSYGCPVFALHDAISFLRDKEFFSKITCSRDTVKIDEQYEIQTISSLPMEFMVGTQSTSLIEDCRRRKADFDVVLIGRKKSLQIYLDEHLVRDREKWGLQNHYITRKTFTYLTFVVLALEQLGQKKIDAIISRTLIR